MDVVERDVRVYQDIRGKSPFHDWLEALHDRGAVAKIRVRLARVRLGNLGYHKPVGEGVMELKIGYGPGYRIYFSRRQENTSPRC